MKKSELRDMIKEELKLNEAEYRGGKGDGQRTLNLIINKIKSMGLEVKQSGSQIIISKRSGEQLIGFQVEWTS